MATNAQIETKTCNVCGTETTINPSALYFGKVQIVCPSDTCDVHEVQPLTWFSNLVNATKEHLANIKAKMS